MSSPGELSPRMQQILDAAVRVTARSGLRGLTHRGVDAEAGLSQGSTSAYLRTRVALLTAVTDHVAAALTGPIDLLAEKVRSGADDAVVIGDAIELFVGWLGDPDLVLARSELGREALRVQEVRDAMAPWQERLVATVAEMLERVEVDRPAVKAGAVVAALDGVLGAALTRPVAERERYVREVAEIIITAFVTPRPAAT